MESWATGLPQNIFLGCSIGDDESRVITQMDSGPTTVRKRFTSFTQTVSAPIIFTGAELKIFYTFYRTTINQGTDSFRWKNPVTDESVTFRFKSAPKFECIKPSSNTDNRLWSGNLEMEILP